MEPREKDFPYYFFNLSEKPGTEKDEAKNTVGFFGYLHYR